MGIQLKQNEMTYDMYDDFKLKKPFGVRGLYTIFQRFNPLTADAAYIPVFIFISTTF